MFQNYTEYVQKNTPEPVPQSTPQQQQENLARQQEQVQEQFRKDCIARLAKDFADAGIGYKDAEEILYRTIRTLQMHVLAAPVPQGNVTATEWGLQVCPLKRWAD